MSQYIQRISLVNPTSNHKDSTGNTSTTVDIPIQPVETNPIKLITPTTDVINTVGNDVCRIVSCCSPELTPGGFIETARGDAQFSFELLDHLHDFLATESQKDTPGNLYHSVQFSGLGHPATIAVVDDLGRKCSDKSKLQLEVQGDDDGNISGKVLEALKHLIHCGFSGVGLSLAPSKNNEIITSGLRGLLHAKVQPSIIRVSLELLKIAQNGSGGEDTKALARILQVYNANKRLIVTTSESENSGNLGGSVDFF